MACEDFAKQLTGTYVNQHNSTMKIEADAKDRSLKGTYETGVGKASGLYELHGGFTCSGSLGFVVAWQNAKFGDSKTTAAWSGSYNAEKNIISTTWTLSDNKGLWNSTLTGSDIFQGV